MASKQGNILFKKKTELGKTELYMIFMSLIYFYFLFLMITKQQNVIQIVNHSDNKQQKGTYMMYHSVLKLTEWHPFCLSLLYQSGPQLLSTIVTGQWGGLLNTKHYHTRLHGSLCMVAMWWVSWDFELNPSCSGLPELLKILGGGLQICPSINFFWNMVENQLFKSLP